jgi:hypothetical protein
MPLRGAITTGRYPWTAAQLYDAFILRFKVDPRFAAFCGKLGLRLPVRQQTDRAYLLGYAVKM